MIIVFVTFLQKLWELAKQVSEFLVWRQVICPFDRDRRILQYLVTTSVYTEDGQYKLEHFHINYQICKPQGNETEFVLLLQSCTWPPMRAKDQKTTWRKTAAGL